MRRKAIIAIAAAALLLGPVPAAAASPASSDVKITTTSVHWLNDDGTGRKATASPTPLTPEQVRKEAQRKHATYTADASDYTSLRAKDYDYISPSECKSNAESGNAGGWTKNHFAWCGRLYADHKAKTCDNPQDPATCRTVGTFRVQYDIIGYGRHEQADSSPSTTDRHMNFTIVVNDIPAAMRTGVYTSADSTLSLGISCVTQDADKNCRTGSANGATRKLDEWKTQPNTYVELISPANEPSKANGDQFIHADVTSVSAGQAPGYPPTTPKVELPMTSIRFDSSWYNQQAKRGSIFTVVDPFLRFSRADNTGYKQVADHLWQALNRPGETKPPFSDKQLPGRTINNPLHRLVPSYSDANNTRVNSNRYYAKAWGCNPYFPNWNVPVEYPPEYPQGRPVQECDEYPFASTYEGAARWKTDGDQYKNMFSAKPVYWRDNQAAGTLLGNWYDWDRIAEHQAFYIKVD